MFGEVTHSPTTIDLCHVDMPRVHAQYQDGESSPQTLLIIVQNHTDIVANDRIYLTNGHVSLV